MGERDHEGRLDHPGAARRGSGVVQTPEGCRLTWTLALDVRGPSRLGMPLGKPLMNAAFGRFLKNLRKYTDERFA